MVATGLTPIGSEASELTGAAGQGTTQLAIGNDRLFAACNSYVYELDPNTAAIRWAFDLSGVNSEIGRNPVDLCFYDNRLYAGVHGYVVRLDVPATHDSPASGPTNYRWLKLPSCGNHTTTLARDKGGNLFAGCNGFVYKVHPDADRVIWEYELTRVKSGFEHGKVYMCALHTGGLLAGSNGYVARPSTSDSPGYHEDANGKNAYELSASGHDTVHDR